MKCSSGCFSALQNTVLPKKKSSNILKIIFSFFSKLSNVTQRDNSDYLETKGLNRYYEWQSKILRTTQIY